VRTSLSRDVEPREFSNLISILISIKTLENNENYYTIALKLLVNIVLSSKFHLKMFKLNQLSFETIFEPHEPLKSSKEGNFKCRSSVATWVCTRACSRPTEIRTFQPWEGCRESRRCSRDTHPESYITKYTSIRKNFALSLGRYTAVERIGHIQDSQGHTLALAFR